MELYGTVRNTIQETVVYRPAFMSWHAPKNEQKGLVAFTHRQRVPAGDEHPLADVELAVVHDEQVLDVFHTISWSFHTIRVSHNTACRCEQG